MANPAAVDKLRPKSNFLIMAASGAAAGAVMGAGWALLHRGAALRLPHSFREAIINSERFGFPPAVVFSWLLWIAFSLYWESAARKASKIKTSESPRSRRIHLALVTAAQVLVLLPVPGLRVRFLPSASALVVTGLILEVGFILFAAWARERLGRNWSGAVAITVDQQLVRSGPYRLVRHPIYSAMLGLYFSMTLVWGEVHALIGFVLVCFAYWRKIRIEEQYLSVVFGRAYDDYRDVTPAVIPSLL